MANVIVHEFTTPPDSLGNVAWPAAKVTALSTGGSMSTGTNTCCVAITTDADTRMTFDGSAVTAAAVPVLSPVANVFKLASGNVARKLTFQ